MQTKVKTKSEAAGAAKGGRKVASAGGDKSALPLYVQVAGALKEEVVSGVYPVGSLLPTEDALCERFAVSRYTVREALRLLRDDGLVASRQGAGTVVIPPRATGGDIHQVMSINDLVALGTDTRLVIESIKMVEIDDKLAVKTGLTKGEEWLEVRAYRHGDDAETPLCLAEYFINRQYAAVGRLLQRHNGPIFSLIEDMFGEKIVEVNQQISATLVPAALAGGLLVKEGVPALEIRRTYKTSDNRIAQVTINTHPASRFQHSMTMRRVKS